MKKVLIRSFMVVAVLTALVLPAGAAHAAGAGVCVVQGNVNLADPLNSNGRNSSYTFTDTSLDCTGTADINGVWNVTASGNTTGIVSGGETCQQGKNAGPGTLNGTSSGGRSFSGSVSFTRVGSVVIASGSFTSNTSKTYTWAGVFQFTPAPVTDATNCTSQSPAVGVDKASLNGVATVATTD